MNKSLITLMSLLLAFATGCASSGGDAKSATPPRSFASPDAAVNALVNALRAGDAAAIRDIFGQEGADVLPSGDDVADREDRRVFLAAYDVKHSLGANADGTVTLIVGESDWPMPIPLVREDEADGGDWWFDVAAGKDEILARRIGRNELATIQVCRAVADAQREYAERDPDGNGVRDYAGKFFSDPGRRNGLYWKPESDGMTSPLGELIAAATESGYFSAHNNAGEPQPYHGYLYRMLTSQGPAAPGGAENYVINGRMLGGFAVVAYPAEYANSGVMTFIINHSGIVHQRDLGPQTPATARAMTAYDPGAGWSIVADK